jgi:hypothetical protein
MTLGLSSILFDRSRSIPFTALSAAGNIPSVDQYSKDRSVLLWLRAPRR